MNKLANKTFDLMHNLVYDFLMETKGECDHDEHGQILTSFVKTYKTNTKRIR